MSKLLEQLTRCIKDARKELLGNRPARFGDCAMVSFALRWLIQERLDLAVDVDAGHFVCDLEQQISFEHTWVVMPDQGWLIDPTVEQFSRDLDVDFFPQIPGVLSSCRKI